MKRRLTFVALAAGLTTFVGITAVAVAGPGGSESATACVLSTQLSPENEVRTTPNTSVASGHAQIKVRNDGTIEFKTFVLNPAGESFFMAHIHGRATFEQNASVLVDILIRTLTTGIEERTFTLMGEGVPRASAPTDIADQICANPELYYVNFHTTVEQPGAIRGQLG